MRVTATVPSLLERGLSRRDAERRLARFGPNALPDPTQVLRWQQWLERFKSPLIYILLFALTLDLSLWLWQGPERWPVESSSIGLILLPNAGLGVYQEGKAEQALARLKALAVPSVWVIRDGVLVEVSARNLVPGDIARIEAGDRVPADVTAPRETRPSSARSAGNAGAPHLDVSLPPDDECAAEELLPTVLVDEERFTRDDRVVGGDALAEGERTVGRRHVGCAAHLGARRAHMPMDDRGVTDPYRVSLPPSDRDAAS